MDEEACETGGDDDVEGEERHGDFQREPDATDTVVHGDVGQWEYEREHGDGAEACGYRQGARDPDPVAEATQVRAAKGMCSFDEEEVPGGRTLLLASMFGLCLAI